MHLPKSVLRAKPLTDSYTQGWFLPFFFLHYCLTVTVQGEGDSLSGSLLPGEPKPIGIMSPRLKYLIPRAVLIFI